MRSLFRQALDTVMGIAIYAQGLAGRFKVKVQFDANAPTAMTDSKVVILPTFALPQNDEDLPVLERLRDYLYGMTVHEIGHVLFTDFTCGRPEGIGRSIYQSLEDARQEVLMIRQYGGARRYLEAMCRRLIEDGRHRVDAEMSPGDLVAFTTNAWMRTEIREQPEYAEMAELGMALIREKLGEGVATRLHAILVLKGLSMASTSDAVNTAKEIVTMLEEEQAKAEQQAQQPQDSQAPDTAQGDPPQGASQPDAGAQAPGGQPGASQGNPSGSDAPQGNPQGSSSGLPPPPQPSNDGQGGAAGQGSDPGQPDATPTPDPAAIAQAIAQAIANGSQLKDAGELAREAIDSASNEIRRDGNCVEVNDLPPTEGGADAGATPLVLGGQPIDEAAVARETAQLRAKLAVELQTKGFARKTVRSQGNKLSVRHLSRLTAGDSRVFLHRKETRKLDTAVMLLCDVSGSMSSYRRIEIACDALYAAACALESTPGVVVAAQSFPGQGRVLKFGQRAKLNRHNFALRAHGGTPLTEGLVVAARELLARPESRKAMIVLTDGDPHNRPQAKLMIDYLARSGVEIYGIGIQSTSVEGLFPEYGVISDLGELSGVLIGLLKRKLLAHMAA